MIADYCSPSIEAMMLGRQYHKLKKAEESKYYIGIVAV